MLLLSVAFAIFSVPANGQDVCSALLCGNLKVEVVRQAPNISNDCANSSAQCSDKFHQITYKVYLRNKKMVSPSDPLLPFNLDYKMLDIAVSLKDNGTPQFSHIDASATQNCFATGIGAYWNNYNNLLGDKVIFTPTDKDVSISFANLANDTPNCGSSGPNGTTGNVITFTYATPPLAEPSCGGPFERCAYAELFTVVVNAYPGEHLGLQFDVRRYLPKSNASVCDPIPHINTNSGNNGLLNIQVASPVHYGNTSNDNILAQLRSPVTNSDGTKDFQIQLTNTGSAAVTVTYLEFLIKASLLQIDVPLAYIGAMPKEVAGSTDPATGQVTKYLHYLISYSGLTLAPNGGAMIVGTIRVSPPTLSNQSWGAGFSFQDAEAKSRIKTSDACTTLKTSGAPSNSSHQGDALCSGASVFFKVEGVEGSCGGSKVNVGLRSALPPDNLILKKVEFELEFSWTDPGISISAVNYPDWPAPDINCGQDGCFGQVPPLPNVCYDISADGKTFKYCFQTDDANAPTFSLNDFANMEIVFNIAGNGCVATAKVRKLRIIYLNATVPCVPRIDPIDGFPMCGPMLVGGKVTTEMGDGVEEVILTLDGAIVDSDDATDDGIQACASVSCTDPCAPVSDLSDDTGEYRFCQVCTTCDRLKVIPERDDNPLNGVTTYDLVLISKHILGIEPLNSPYKMIAADANKSGSITTFDIVEIRKLILGIYTEFPNNKSWRFVDKAFAFPNLNNPFQTLFPEGYNCIAPAAVGIDFTGVKVGDVNNTVVPNARPSERPNAHLSWPNLRTVAGAVVTVPVTYSGSEQMEAVQMGLRFDPSKLQLLSPSKGDIETYLPDNFNLLKAGEGEIRTLWLPMTDGAERVQPGSVLFYLTFKVLGEMPGSGLPLWLDGQLLDCAAWKPDGTEYALQHAPSVAMRDEPASPALELQASVRPNPSLGDATLVVQALRAEKSRIALFDAFGRRLFVREAPLHEGRQEISLPEVQGLPTGVYVWKIYTPTQKTQGHIVKQ